MLRNGILEILPYPFLDINPSGRANWGPKFRANAMIYFWKAIDLQILIWYDYKSESVA